MNTSIHNDPRTYDAYEVVHTNFDETEKRWIIDGGENVEVAFNRDILRWVEVREDV